MPNGGRSETAPRPGVSALDVVAFLDELVLLAVLAVAGAGLGGSTVACVVLAVVLPLAAATLWGLLLAPRARRRLTGTGGIAAKITLFTLSAVLLAVTGAIAWAAIFWGVSVALLVTADVADQVAVSREGAG